MNWMRYFSILFSLLLIPVVCFGGVDFNGDADYINLGNNASLFIDTPITIGCWTKDANPADNYIFSIGKSQNDRWGFHCADTSGNLWVWDDIDNGNTSIQTTVDISSGNHCIVITIDGTAGTNIYVDGSTSDGSNAGRTLGFDSIGTTDSIVGIGHAILWDGTPTDFFNGEITEFFLSASIWSATQIDSFCNGRLKGYPQNDASLVDYWSLDEHPAGTNLNGAVFKAVPTGNDGTGVDANANSTIVGETVLSYPSQILGN